MSSSTINMENLEAVLNFLTGGLSFLGCIWVFHFYSKTIKPRSVTLKLILWLSISDLIFSISNMIAPFDKKAEAVCTIEGILRLSSTIAGLIWATCIAFSSHRRLSKGEGFQQENFFKKSIIFGIVVAAIFALSPLAINQVEYGPVTFGCFVRASNSSTLLAQSLVQTFYFALPVLISLIWTLMLYYFIAKRIHEFSSDLSDGQSLNIQRLFWYPAIIFLAYLTATIDNFLEIFNVVSSESYIFTTIHILLTHSVGITNALVYGLQRKKYYETYEKPQIQMMQDPKTYPLFHQGGLSESIEGESSKTTPTARSSSDVL